MFFHNDFLHVTFKVIGDALGWGFVIRGMAPCYVQAVDPGSPAAAGGVKVCLLYYNVINMPLSRPLIQAIYIL